MRWWILLLFLGCGGGHGGDCHSAAVNDPNCHAFSACGGDPTGTWTYTDACGLSMQNPFAGICATATWSAASPEITGTLKLGADTSFAYDVSGSQSACFSMPASCLSGTGIGSCQELQNALASEMGPGLTVTANCTGSVSSSCDCTFTVNQNIHQTGSWQVSGTDLLVTTQGGQSSNPFCVSGHELDVGNRSFPGEFIVYSR